MFKQSFKHYKKKDQLPDLQDVIDFDIYEANNSSYSWCNLVKSMNITELHMRECLNIPIGLRPLHMWRCYMLKNHPGLLVIRNPFTFIGQRYWIARSLRDYPLAPNIVNLDAKHFSSNTVSDWWSELHKCTEKSVAHRLKTSMRWTTLGYHYNWDTKAYDEAMHTLFPIDLFSLSQYFAYVLGFPNYIPQAGIINYYPIGTCLSGHTDHSELNHEAPLFSYSFGQTAIFLIGHNTLEEQPSALFLRSGDVLIMSRESRLCYHAIPRVMKSQKEPWNDFLTIPQWKSKETFNSSMNFELYDQVTDTCFWMKFNSYITDSRININVRQVFSSDYCL
ncbi:nucleic acid dioxygenase ALKBH1 isoform X1 [Drosophila novamexicana]|uniref:nucleic acid dioxygenase ALKBH1 isoform X1 n=1 Tax=Drosophila novamexicana TaxID=47314 RepID=UPI0011E5BB9C|nr:nucleic acid dioxygenase ALKBH1 isoform X1 [Drosophila novamexicana]